MPWCIRNHHCSRAYPHQVARLITSPGCWLPSCACSYPLTFTPPGSGSFSGSLELLVSTTGEKLLYTLVGKASEPLAEGHILVECQVSAVQEQ